MTKEEALQITADNNSLEPEITAGHLVELFPKSIEEYTKSDFLDTDKPYEYIQLYSNNKFQQKKIIVKMTAQAKKCGVTNFLSLYKAYVAEQPDTTDDVGYVTDYPNQPLTLRSGNWICDVIGARQYTDRGTVYACPHPIMPVARLTNIDSGIEKIKVAYSKGKAWRTAIFDRKTLSTASKITDLSDVGISVTSETSKNLVNYFYELEQANPDLLPETECVTHLGWIDRGEGREFVPYTEGVVFDGEAEYKKRFGGVKLSGDFGEWMECIKKNIRRNKNVIARITFASALASVLVKPLVCNCFWLHLWGETESAKTVLTMCAASIWGNPCIGNMITTFNSTYVANEKGAAFSGSLPHMIDELQIVDSKKEMDALIYMLTEGAGRARGNKQGGLDAVPTWKNCTISTGERPINSGRANGGAVNRVVECECKDNFFDNPREVAQTVQNNYGFFGKAFIAFLNNEDKMQHAEDLFNDYQKQLTERKITQKQAQSAALILTADKLACELSFDDDTALTIDEISTFLKTKDEVSTNPRAYEYICEQVAANQAHFTINERVTELWGLLDNNNGVYIIKSVFVRMCDEGGFNPSALLSWLSDMRHIEKGSGKKNTVTKRIGGVVTRCVHLYLATDDEAENSESVTESDEFPEF